MNDARLPHSPAPTRSFEVSDERLAAEMKKSQGNAPVHYPVGELLDRHWEAVYSYARLCTHGVRPAGMLTTGAFTRLFGESLDQSGPGAAWRPQLLVTVRRMAAEWLTDQRRDMLHPNLLAGSDREDRAAARLLPPEGRRLLSRAFQRLPEPARCLLWHIEVEAERPEVPAALLGFEAEDVLPELERARERLRAGCLEIHRELAPEQECRRYNRMLDVSLRRRGAGLDPDLSDHMARCGHCRHTAEQLDQFNRPLGLPLAEAVLGWAARDYVASRPGRASAIPAADGVHTADEAAATAPDLTGTPADTGVLAWTGTPADAPAVREVPLPPGLRPRTAARGRGAGDTRTPAHRAPRGQGAGTHKAPRQAPRRREVALAVLTVSTLILVPLVVWAAGTSSGGENGTADGTGRSDAPGPSRSPGAKPSWIGTGARPGETARGLLRNAATGLCVGIVGDKPAKGVEARLTSCTSASARRWTYEADGLLSDAADPGLCLDSHLGYSVRLTACPGVSGPGAKDRRYDFTLQGALVPRWNQDLALAPASADDGAALLLKVRDDGAVQRWELDASSPSLQMEVVNWGSADGGPDTTPAPPTASAPPAAHGSSPTTSTTQPAPATSAPPYEYCTSPYAYCPGDGQYGSGRDPGYGYGDYGYGSGHEGGLGGRR